MATHNLGAALTEKFPHGTSVAVYAANSDVAPSPSGAALFSGTWDGTTGLAATGMTANSKYVLAGVVNGAYRMIHFTALPTATG